MKLHHCTPSVNVESISEMGIDPAFSLGAQKLTWWIDDKRIHRGLAHASLRHRVSTIDLVIYNATVDFEEIRLTAWAGVYTCKTVIRSTRFMPAQTWLAKADAQ